MANVQILLTTYNGSRYIREMIDSIILQDYQDWQLVLSDDGSTDESLEILEEYAGKMPDKIIHYESGMQFGNAQKHFMHLLRVFHDAPYIMFCDQDDVWHKDKIRKTLDKMQQIETDASKPVLVHTDLRVVDQQLSEIAPSFCMQSALDGNRVKLNQLLVQNVVTGCTTMINHALAVLACRDVPDGAMLMHDWWLALLASATGTVGFLNEATIDYRQHGNNSVGAKNVYSLRYLLNRLMSNSMRQGLANSASQAECFAECYFDVLSEKNRELVEAFSNTRKQGLLGRDITYLRYRLFKNGFLRVVIQFLGW